MASEQVSRRDYKTDERETVQVEKDRVPKMASHFEHLAEEAKGSDHQKEKSHEFVSLAPKVSDEQREKERHFNADKARSANMVADKEAEDRKSSDEKNTVGKFEVRGEEEEAEDRRARKEEPTLEEISRLRAHAQQRSSEAIKEAEERYTRALQVAKQGVSSAAKKGSEAKDYTAETGRAVAEKAAAAKDYTAAAAAGVKDKAVAAGWTAAHYSTEKAVDGTAAVARAVKGAAELAAKPFTAAKDAAVSVGDTAKEYTARKKEEAHRATEKQETESHFVEEKDQETAETHRDYGRDFEERGKGSSGGTTVLGAIGETIAEIAQNTKDLVIGGEDQTAQQLSRHTSTDQS